MGPLGFSCGVLDQAMPMHLLVSATGHVERVGPTLQKLRPEFDFVGRRVLEVFELNHKAQTRLGFAELVGLAGQKILLSFREGDRTKFKGIVMPLSGEGQVVINLSFGISVIDAVRTYGLTNADFAPTDLAVEMLYLFEAKTVVMDESRSLNARLNTALQDAEYQATTDPLTGLCNRRAMDQILSQIILSRSGFGLMHLDLDYFKEVNDTYGHAAGDVVLRHAADVLRRETRTQDTVARVGGDEFVLIFYDLVDEPQLMDIADRIVKRLEYPIDVNGAECRISGSIGITTSVFYDAPDPDRMLSDADTALYASKNKGRARATFFNT